MRRRWKLGDLVHVWEASRNRLKAFLHVNARHMRNCLLELSNVNIDVRHLAYDTQARSYHIILTLKINADILHKELQIRLAILEVLPHLLL